MRSVEPQGHSVTVNATGCRFDPTRENIIIFNIFYLFALVSRQSDARNASMEDGEQCLNTRFLSAYIALVYEDT